MDDATLECLHEVPSEWKRRRTRRKGSYRSQRPDSVKPPGRGPGIAPIHCSLDDVDRTRAGERRQRPVPAGALAAGPCSGDRRRGRVAEPGREHCVLDGSRLEELDTAAGFVLLHRLAELGCIAGTVEVRHMAEAHARLLRLVRERMAAPSVAAPSRHRGALERVGRATVLLGRTCARRCASSARSSSSSRRAAAPAPVPAQGNGVAVRDRHARRDRHRRPGHVPDRRRLRLPARRSGAALRRDDLRRRRRRPGDLPRALADPGRGDRRRPLRRRVHGADRLDEGAGGDRRDPYPGPLADPGAGGAAAGGDHGRPAAPRVRRRPGRHRRRHADRLAAARRLADRLSRPPAHRAADEGAGRSAWSRRRCSRPSSP